MKHQIRVKFVLTLEDYWRKWSRLA